MKFLSWLVLGAAGYFLADLILGKHTLQTIPNLLRFVPLVGIPVCAPIWKLYDNLRKIREHDELSKKEFREVAFKVENNVRKMFFNMCYLLIGSPLLVLMLLTIDEPNHIVWLLKGLSVFILTSLGILANTIFNLKEIEAFETMLAKRKNNRTRSKELLKQMKGKDSD